MHTGIVGEFRMEGRSHHSSLPDSDGISAFGGKDLDAFSHMGNFGRADENHFEWGFIQFSLKVAKKLALTDGAVDLASVGVAADADVEGAKAVLRGIFDFFGEKNGPGAGAESWLGFYKISQLVESSFAKELQKSAGFAAWDDEAVDVVELLRLLDEDNFGTEFLEPTAVGIKIALQGQDSDDHWAKSVSITDIGEHRRNCVSTSILTDRAEKGSKALKAR